MSWSLAFEAESDPLLPDLTRLLSERVRSAQLRLAKKCGIHPSSFGVIEWQTMPWLPGNQFSCRVGLLPIHIPGMTTHYIPPEPWNLYDAHGLCFCLECMG